MPERFARRFCVMCGGILLMGLGVAMFRLSLMGNDPCNAMAMAVGERLGLPYAFMFTAISCVWFVVEFCLGRQLIGAGTFVNWFGVGTITTLFIRLLTALGVTPQALAPRVVLMVAGVLVLSLSLSLYQTADLGISPFDSISVIMARRLPLPYFWCRLITDCFCAAVTFLCGGLLGPGTLLCAFGLGPFISFFDRLVSRRLCGVDAAD